MSFLNIPMPDNLIPDLDEYCDKWCDKCPQHRMCERYYELRHFRKTDPEEDNYFRFWFYVRLQFGLEEAYSDEPPSWEFMKKHPGKLTEEDYNRYLESVKLEAIRLRENYPYVTLCEDYAKSFDNWIKKYFEPMADLEEREFHMQFTHKNQNSEHLSIAENIEIAARYQDLLKAELPQAAESYGNWKEMDDEIAKENAWGIAKLAFIVLKKSQTALYQLYLDFPQAADDTIGLLAFTEKIYNKLMEFHPEAQNYIRKGLDDV